MRSILAGFQICRLTSARQILQFIIVLRFCFVTTMSESATLAKLPGELDLQVHVASALSGNELMPWTSFPRDNVLSHVRRHLGCRPSQPVTLFHCGSILTRERPLVLQASWTAIELFASVSDAVSAEVRDELLRKIVSQTDRRLGV